MEFNTTSSTLLHAAERLENALPVLEARFHALKQENQYYRELLKAAETQLEAALDRLEYIINEEAHT